MIRFVHFKIFRDNPPNGLDGFQYTMSQTTFEHQKFAFRCITQLAPFAQSGNFGHINE